MFWSVTWCVQEIEASIAKPIDCFESSNGYLPRVLVKVHLPQRPSSPVGRSDRRIRFSWVSWCKSAGEGWPHDQICSTGK